MLYFDVTNSHRSRTKSGLQRVAQALLRALEAEAEPVPVAWNPKRRAYQGIDKAPRQPQAGDALLVPDIFSEEDRPGYAEFIKNSPARTVAIFHDAIPVRFPEFTWPHSVRKAPRYLKDLARFDQVLAVSHQSRDELLGFWAWAGLETTPPVTVVPSGADIHPERPRNTRDRLPNGRLVLQTGILEPRKNQMTTLEAAGILYERGVDFRLGFIGRVNPHFGKPIAKTIRHLEKSGLPVTHHGKLSDDELATLLAEARFTLLPSRVEGNGLPVLESLWQGLPVICSNLPVARDWANGESVRIVDPMTPQALANAIQTWLEDDDAYQRAARHAREVNLPTWRDAARAILQHVGGITPSEQRE